MTGVVVDLKMKNEDKERALEAAIGQIEKAFGKGSVMKLGQRESAVDVQAISTGSLGLDIGLGIGGFPKGRIIEIYGPESSGKTTLALHAVAERRELGAELELQVVVLPLQQGLPRGLAGGGRLRRVQLEDHRVALQE